MSPPAARARAIARGGVGLGLAALLALPAAAAGPRAAAEPVIWMDLVNVSARGTALLKSGGCDGCPDAKARSRQRIAGGDGYVEFSAVDTVAVRYVGLSEAASVDPAQMAYAIRLQSGVAEVRERGVYRADAPFARGDVIRVAVESGKVSYYRNGDLLYRSRVAPSFPLFVSASLLGQDSGITDVVISVVGRDAAGDGG